MLQNQKLLKQIRAFCDNDIAFWKRKAENANLENLRFRKYNTQFYTASSASLDDNCTTEVCEVHI